MARSGELGAADHSRGIGQGTTIKKQAHRAIKERDRAYQARVREGKNREHLHFGRNHAKVASIAGEPAWIVGDARICAYRYCPHNP